MRNSPKNVRILYAGQLAICACMRHSIRWTNVSWVAVGSSKDHRRSKILHDDPLPGAQIARGETQISLYADQRKLHRKLPLWLGTYISDTLLWPPNPSGYLKPILTLLDEKRHVYLWCVHSCLKAAGLVWQQIIVNLITRSQHKMLWKACVVCN